MSFQFRLCSSLKSAGSAVQQKVLKDVVILDNLFKRNVLQFSVFGKQKSTSSEDRVVITDDGSTIVCWHPERPFPYECSKPLPESPTVEHSVLKVQNSSNIYEVFKTTKEDQVRQELMNITHTTKHRWFPNNKNFKRRKAYRDREYL